MDEGCSQGSILINTLSEMIELYTPGETLRETLLFRLHILESIFSRILPCTYVAYQRSFVMPTRRNNKRKAKTDGAHGPCSRYR